MNISKHSACSRQIGGASWHNWLYSGVHPVVSTGCRCGGCVTLESWTRETCTGWPKLDGY